MIMTAALNFSAPFTRLVVIGSGQVAGRALEYAASHDVEALFFTSPRLVGEQLSCGRTIAEIARSNNQAVLVTETLKSAKDELSRWADGGQCLVLSFGSPFIMPEWFLQMFSGRVINAHAAPLPEWRGAGGHSWRIMTGDRRGMVCFHQVTPGLDDGPIIHQEPYEFPPECRKPRDRFAYNATLEAAALITLLDTLRGGGTFTSIYQDESRATYYPRLHTDTHGAIDWSWKAEDVERFILAFSAPYPGARTTLGGQSLRILDAFAEQVRQSHPFFSGLVFRADDKNIWVHCGEGVVRIPLDAITGDTIPALGDRLWTPAEDLEKARLIRVQFTTTGMRRV